MTKKSKPKPKTPATAQVARRDSEWVASMHAHYQRTGCYRAADLEKVMGDPREGVEMPSGGPKKGLAHSMMRK